MDGGGKNHSNYHINVHISDSVGQTGQTRLFYYCVDMGVDNLGVVGIHVFGLKNQ